MKKLTLVFNFALISVWVAAQVPKFQWVKTIGGKMDDIGYALTVDDSGNVFSAGAFSGTADFDPDSTSYNLTSSSGSVDIYIIKSDSSGNFKWAKRVGGKGYDGVRAIAVSYSGEVYATGYFNDTVDFDPGAGTTRLIAGATQDIFILKLNSSGNFVWVAHLPSSGLYNIGNGITFDNSGNVYTTGVYQGTIDFDPGKGVYNQTVPSSCWGTFISKLNSSGQFIWAKSVHGPKYYVGIEAEEIVVDKTKNVFIVGRFSGRDDFDPGNDSFMLTSGGVDAFISKLDSSGNFLWARNFGSAKSKNVVGYGIALDPEGNVYSTGKFIATADFDPDTGTYYLTATAGTSTTDDIYISKLNSFGNFVWAKKIGGSETDIGYFIASDVTGNVYVTGLFGGTVDFNPGPGKYNLTSKRSDVFILKLDTAGNFDWAKKIGGRLDDEGKCIAVRSGTIYTTGSFKDSVDFNPGNGKSMINSFGSGDAFVHKMTEIACKESYGSINTKACNFYVSPSGKFIWTTSGTFLDTLMNHNDCDSFLTIILSIEKTSYGTISPVTCNTYTSPSKRYVWSIPGTYRDTINSMAGCDSVITINLMVFKKTSGYIKPDVCNSYISPSKRYSWSTTGTYSDTLLNKAGCDSIVSIDLRIRKSSWGSIAPISCVQYISPSKKKIWNMDGTYYDTIPNKAGCDSFININLTIKKVDITVTNSAPKLTANASADFYQWLDCNAGYKAIEGALFKSYTPVKNGSYAVAIFQKGCFDTSSCYIVDNVSITSTLLISNIRLFPNPTSGEFHILFENYPVTEVTVMNALGEVIVQKEVSGPICNLKIEEPPGLYVVKVVAYGNRAAILKLIKY